MSVLCTAQTTVIDCGSLIGQMNIPQPVRAPSPPRDPLASIPRWLGGSADTNPQTLGNQHHHRTLDLHRHSRKRAFWQSGLGHLPTDTSSLQAADGCSLKD